MEASEIDSLNIPIEEKRNLSNLLILMDDEFRQRNIRARLEVVGGVTNKPWPRKDIDVSVYISDGLTFPEGTTRLDRYTRAHQILREAVDSVASKSTYRVIDTINPHIDHQHNSPEILRHTGSVVVSGSTSTRLELVCK